MPATGELGYKILTDLNQRPLLTGVRGVVELSIRLTQSMAESSGVPELRNEPIVTVANANVTSLQPHEPRKGDLWMKFTITLTPDKDKTDVVITVKYKDGSPETEITLPVEKRCVKQITPATIQPDKLTLVEFRYPGSIGKCFAVDFTGNAELKTIRYHHERVCVQVLSKTGSPDLKFTLKHEHGNLDKLPDGSDLIIKVSAPKTTTARPCEDAGRSHMTSPTSGRKRGWFGKTLGIFALLAIIASAGIFIANSSGGFFAGIDHETWQETVYAAIFFLTAATVLWFIWHFLIRPLIQIHPQPEPDVAEPPQPEHTEPTPPVPENPPVQLEPEMIEPEEVDGPPSLSVSREVI